MPEGDTIHRAARTLERGLSGLVVTGFRSPVAGLSQASLEGVTVARVEARGKHLLIHFNDGRVLRTHMRMSGSWHLYQPGESWRKPARQARVVIETPERVAVCFNAPDVELVRRAPALDLGPDLLDPDVEASEIAQRWRSMPDLPIGVAVMRQHLAAGIGNVYKSETLFLERLDPFARTGDLEDSALERLAARAQQLLRANMGDGPRTTRRRLRGSRYWVYGRSGKPCLQCGTRVRMRRQGVDGRSTYFCASCQGVSVSPSRESSSP